MPCHADISCWRPSSPRSLSMWQIPSCRSAESRQPLQLARVGISAVCRLATERRELCRTHCNEFALYGTVPMCGHQAVFAPSTRLLSDAKLLLVILPVPGVSWHRCIARSVFISLRGAVRHRWRRHSVAIGRLLLLSLDRTVIAKW